jgi:hypothetical protein
VRSALERVREALAEGHELRSLGARRRRCQQGHEGGEPDRPAISPTHRPQR